MIKPLANAWPSDVPLPMLTNSGQPLHPLTSNSIETQGPVQRRLRFGGDSPITLAVKWAMTIAQYESFQSFFKNDLGIGAAAFTMDALHPEDQGVQNWVVQFDGDYNAQFQEGVWMVTAKIYLLYLSSINDAASIIGTEGFLVLPGGEQFVTEDGFDFFVKT
jgi:hypothetical protein